ncbi:MAG: hypothetical protein HKO12_09550, partial [Woeseiaceae bacterium]|nr:hypothetical protein [Woeseiaceae bacterium]
MANLRAAHRKILLWMAARISVYYLGLAAAIAVAITVFPSVIDQLPLG